MPIQALRSVQDHFDRVLRSVRPGVLVRQVQVADKAFFTKHFKGYRPDAIGRGRLRKIADREVFQDPGHELFANLLILHWNEVNARLYNEMVAHVKTVNEDVEAIERIEDPKAHAIIDDLLTRHAREDVLLCVRLNGVRFDEEVIQSRLVRGEPAPSASTAEAAAETPPATAPADAAPAASTGA
jgi:hypothetical protein